MSVGNLGNEFRGRDGSDGAGSDIDSVLEDSNCIR